MVQTLRRVIQPQMPSLQPSVSLAFTSHLNCYSLARLNPKSISLDLSCIADLRAILYGSMVNGNQSRIQTNHAEGYFHFR